MASFQTMKVGFFLFFCVIVLTHHIESNISIAENIVAILSNQDPEHNGVVPRGAVYEVC